MALLSMLSRLFLINGGIWLINGSMGFLRKALVQLNLSNLYNSISLQECFSYIQIIGLVKYVVTHGIDKR
ncbi:MAG: hypothetical protein B6247_03905 [Candidatus Parabeggiatoa sp. nov. 2]|nr:MAG: hypothetical protein B6247_03905 [Beggiatoa sp. 4572_84]